MNKCLVCNKLAATCVSISDTMIPLLGTIESSHGWVAHSDCMFSVNTTSL
jgi:hypothetical protein